MTHGTARYDAATATLTIHAVTPKGRKVDTSYRVEALESHPEIGHPALRLVKLNGKEGTLMRTAYDLIFTEYGLACDCCNWMAQYGREPIECKHGRAVVALKLLENLS